MSGTAVAICLGVCWPLVTAIGLLHGRTRPLARGLAPWAPLPIMIISLLVPWLAGSGRTDYGWLMFGGLLGIDAVGAALLPAMAGLWLAAGLAAVRDQAADRRRDVFSGFYLLTMTGNFLLLSTLDAIVFYLGFTVMTFAAYGLIVHEGGVRARHAGRFYIALAVLGEVCIVAGLMLAAGRGDTGFTALRGSLAAGGGEMALALIIVGFGVKAGLVGVHYWLPLAHPVAPTPASAVLSGAMIKAGLLAWVRLLPLGEAALPAWGSAVAAAGLITAVWGVCAGLPQREAKTVLAYSSMSQMGLMMMPVGFALGAPAQWPLLRAALLVFMVHHCLAKGTLFLGTAVMKSAQGTLTIVTRSVLTAAALSLSAAPLTAGLLAKTGVKLGAAGIAGPWHDQLPWLLGASSVLTALLMLRFLNLVWPADGYSGRQQDPPAHPPVSWLLLFLASLTLPWAVGGDELRIAALGRHAQWSALPPLIVAALVAGFMLYLGRRGRLPRLPELPPGDLGIVLERGLLAGGSHLRSALLRLGDAAHGTGQRLGTSLLRTAVRWSPRGAMIEERLAAWSLTGVLVVLTGVLAALLLM